MEEKITSRSGVGELDGVEHLLSELHRIEEENRQLREQLEKYKKLHGELSESFDEFLALQKLSEVINSTLDEQIITLSLLKLIREVIPFSEGAVFIKSGDGYEGYPEQEKLKMEKLFFYLLDEGIVEWLVEKKSAIILPAEDLILEENQRLEGANFLLIPLSAFNEEIGLVIAATSKPQEAYQFKEFELVNMLALQAALAFHHTRIYKKLKIAHEELKKSQNELVRTIKLATVGELSSGIAHEINNPLQIILGNIQLARLKKNYEETLQTIEEQSYRIATIVKSLLTFVRQDYKDIFNEYIDVNQTIHKAYNLVRGQLEKSGIKVSFDGLKPVPSIQLNSNYCQQIFLNLFLNIKRNFSESGELYIESEEKDDYIEIKVRDTGKPMPEEFVRRILQPFEAQGTSTEPLQLSFAVSVQMIKDINGLIHVEAGKDGGNEITILLPKTQEKNDEEISV